MIKKMIMSTLLILMVTGIVACSGGEDPKDDSKETKLESEKIEPATLVLHNTAGLDEEGFNEFWGNAIKEQIPEVTIKFIPKSESDLETLIASGSQLDIIMSSTGSATTSVLATGSEYDISNLVKKHKVDLDRFDPAHIEALNQMGGLYGLPVKTGGLVTYYNKEIFDKFGEDYPKDGMNWEDVIELSRKLTREDEGETFLGLSVFYQLYMRMNPLSVPMIDPNTQQPTYDNPLWKKIFETILIEPTSQMEYQDYLANNPFPRNEEFARDRNIAMYVMNYGLNNGPSFEGLDWDMVSPPTFEDKPGVGTQPYADYFFISAASKYKDQAMQVLKVATSDEVQMNLSKSGTIPSLVNENVKNAFAMETDYSDKNVKNAVFYHKYATPSAKNKYDGDMERVFMKLAKSIANQSKDINTALREAQDNAILELEGKKSN